MKFDLNRPRELFSMDFANGHYRLDGVTVAEPAMFKVNADLGATRANDIVAGKGMAINSTALGNTFSHRTVSDAAFALIEGATDGIWVVLDYRIEAKDKALSTIAVNLANSAWTVGGGATMWTGVHPFTGNVQYIRMMRNAGEEIADCPIVIGDGKVALALSPTRFGGVSTGETGPWTVLPTEAADFNDATFFGVSVGANVQAGGGEALAIVRSMTVYAAGEVSELTRLIA